MSVLIWELVFVVVRELIENWDCPDSERRRERLRNPGPVRKRIFEARLHRKATSPFTGIMSEAEWRANRKEILDEAFAFAESADDTELDQICGP